VITRLVREGKRKEMSKEEFDAMPGDECINITDETNPIKHWISAPTNSMPLARPKREYTIAREPGPGVVYGRERSVSMGPSPWDKQAKRKELAEHPGPMSPLQGTTVFKWNK
jgi:hypothetical protein